ncbi:MAG: hypothetical protein AABZ67_10515 [Pseudomonadota bacterium]
MRQMKWLGLAAMVFATLAMAQTPPQKIAAQNGVSFVSGGIGVDSEERLKAREKEFNLKLVFTLVEGNYLSDVGVSIKNAGGKTLVEHVADGPFFLAKLPAGTYTVATSYEGKNQIRKVSVGAGLKTEYFRWASNPQTDYVLPRESPRK